MGFCGRLGLREITEAIERTENQFWLVESKTVAVRAEILASFLEDCLAALMTFKEVSEHLAEILGSNGKAKSSATAIETLSQIMGLLETCSEKVSGLPGSGLAASSQCLAETAINLKGRVDKLVGNDSSLP